ncbi:MAG TPA: UDP-3-O-acyl-N-acetylglucosamine deacetylase [Elusimicrobiota bacterium]|nr:UDP-3-O-acyl-N-acetylglucosamine deacetylase [Elusimicrobiota bacterium]
MPLVTSDQMQHTISKEVVFKGIGLHTGNKCLARFKPAPAGAGISFVRIDLPDKPVLPAHFSGVSSVIRGTTLNKNDVKVHTVEHMLSALQGLNIDNVVIEMDANEPPVADGSARPFVELLQQAGRTAQDRPRQYLTTDQPIVYTAGETTLRLDPAEVLTVDCTVQFKHPLIGEQKLSVVVTPESFLRDIAPARTFCFDYEVEALQRQGLARGGSLDNAVVVGMNKIHNKEKKLRFPDEFVRHKIMDLLGDIYLIGFPIRAKITALRCGHGHNVNFVKLIAERLLHPAPSASN